MSEHRLRFKEYRLDYLGRYYASARGRRALSQQDKMIVKPMVDGEIFGRISGQFDLQVDKDNKSVWKGDTKEDQWRSLSRYGTIVSSTYFEREKLRNESERSTVGDSDNSGERSDRPEPIQPRRTSDSSVGRGDPGRSSEVGGAVRYRGELYLPSPGDRDLGRDRSSGPDPRVYEHAKAATLRAAGRGSRGYSLLSINDVVEKVLHLDKSAGAPHFSRVADALPAGIQRATALWNGERGFDPYVGYRRIQHGNDRPKGRLVWGSPLSTTIVASQFAKAAYQGLQQRKPFVYGNGKRAHGNSVAAIQSRVKRLYCLDFSGFDQRIPDYVIADAFGILKTHIDMNAKEEEMFYKLVGDFIHSRIIMPDFSMWRKHRGIPSGSPFTSMIGSICNLLILNYVWIKLTGSAINTRNCLILGDDSVVGTNAQPSLNEISEAAWDLGVVVHGPGKSSVVTTISDKVEFLGHSWSNGRPHRDLRDTALSLTFPERHVRMTPELRALRMAGLATDSVEAYRWIVSLIREEMGFDASADQVLFELSRRARGSPLDSRASTGWLRYLMAVEPELLTDVRVSVKLVSLGLLA